MSTTTPTAPAPRLGKNRHFWRACRFLWPYRNKVIISILAALFVGVTSAGSLMTMLPVFRVLVNHDTLQAWVYRQAAEQRLGAKFTDDLSCVQISTQIDKNGPADKAGLAPLAEIEDADVPTDAPISPFPDTTPSLRASELLRRIALANVSPLHLTVKGQVQPAPVVEKNISFYSRLGLKLAARLPINPVAAFAVVFAAFAAMSITANCLRYFQEHLADQAAILAVNDVRRRLYGRVLRAPMEFFGQHGTSDVTSRLVSDADTLQDGFKQVLGQSIQEPIKATIFLGLALFLSWKLTLLMVCFAPVMAVVIGKFGRKMRRASRAALRSSSAMLGRIEGTLLGIRVVKASHAQRFERQRYRKVMDGLVREQIHMSHIDAFSAPVLETMILLMAGVILMGAAWLMFIEKSHSLKSEQFFGVMISLAIIVESLRKASKVNVAMQKANAAAGRIFESMDHPVETQRAPVAGTGARARRLRPLQVQIEFRGVTFTYPNGAAPAVCDVGLIVPRGQSVAIVGRNGSGKTTLLALLERFYDPQIGQILIDGVDIRTASLASLRRQISIVTQDSVIFPGTIAENIAYGNPIAAPEAPDTPTRKSLFAKIEDAARRAFAHDFIMEKPQGYHTLLGELGGQLSGGQKQRLCIARAILRSAPILILDEATSQVDAESEHLIQQATERLIHQRTTFVIAHRFSTIMSTDTIVVMDRGRIVGQGRHDELLRSCETYKHLYERQRLGETG